MSCMGTLGYRHQEASIDAASQVLAAQIVNMGADGRYPLM
jgi:hypothetical protein